MSKIKEAIVASVLPTIKEIGKLEIENVFTGIKANNSAEFYKNTLLELHANFSVLKDVAVKTSTKIDDGIIDLVLEAVRENAKSGGIILS